MEIEKLIKAIRCCGSAPKLDRCKNECAFYCGGDMNKCIPKMTQAVADALEKVTAERDAAIEDLNAIGKGDEICLYCIHNLDGGENGEKCLETDFDCALRNAVCGCRDCHYNSNWQWRGKGESNG